MVSGVEGERPITVDRCLRCGAEWEEGHACLVSRAETAPVSVAVPPVVEATPKFPKSVVNVDGRQFRGVVALKVQDDGIVICRKSDGGLLRIREYGLIETTPEIERGVPDGVE